MSGVNNDRGHLGTILKTFSPFYSKYIRKSRIYFIEAFVCLILLNVLELSLPFFQKEFVDRGLVPKNVDFSIFFALALGGVALIASLLKVLWEYLYNFLSDKSCYEIEKDLYLHLLRLPIKFFDLQRTGELMKRVLDSRAILGVVNSFLFDIANNLLLIALSLLACFFINPILALVSVAFVPCALVFNILQGRLARRYEKERWEIDRVQTSDQADALIGIRTIKALGITDRIFRRYKFLRLKYRQLDFHFKRLSAQLNSLNFLFNNTETALIMIVAGILCAAGQISIGDWIAYRALILRVTVPLRQLISVNMELQRNFVALGRLNDIATEPEEIEGYGRLRGISVGVVEFRSVVFQYSSEERVLKGVSFILEAGRSMALVGRSGVGKSTIANLLLGFYQPTEGAICIDGENLANYDRSFLLKDVAVVLQDPYLFSGSIRENLSLAAPKASEIDIIEACKVACIHDFIVSLSNGYDTEVGERGVKLSGGQKQRVALAQAVLKKPKILILDEATSHLDSETEGKVQEALSYLMRRTTSIIIAHRLSTIRSVDRIAVVEDGNIVELGSHEELMEQDSRYKAMLAALASV